MKEGKSDSFSIRLQLNLTSKLFVFNRLKCAALRRDQSKQESFQAVAQSQRSINSASFSAIGLLSYNMRDALLPCGFY